MYLQIKGWYYRVTPSWFQNPIANSFEEDDKVLCCNCSVLPRNDAKIILNHRNAKKWEKPRKGNGQKIKIKRWEFIERKQIKEKKPLKSVRDWSTYCSDIEKGFTDGVGQSRIGYWFSRFTTKLQTHQFNFQFKPYVSGLWGSMILSTYCTTSQFQLMAISHGCLIEFCYKNLGSTSSIPVKKTKI